MMFVSKWLREIDNVTKMMQFCCWTSHEMIHDDTDLWWHLVLVNSLRTKQRRKARMLKRTQMLAMEEGYSKEVPLGGGSE